MPIYDAKSIPAEVYSGTKDPEVAAFLKTGSTERTAAFANMADVVQHSTQYLTDDDLTAIAERAQGQEDGGGAIIDGEGGFGAGEFTQ